MKNRTAFNFKFHVLGDIIEQPAISSMKDLIGKAVLIKNEMNQNYYVIPEYSYNTKHYAKSSMRDSSSAYKQMIWFIDKSPLGDDYYTINPIQLFSLMGKDGLITVIRKPSILLTFIKICLTEFSEQMLQENLKRIADLKGTRESVGS